MKTFIASYKNRSVKVYQISAAKAIKTAAKIFGVKMNKVSVREIRSLKAQS